VRRRQLQAVLAALAAPDVGVLVHGGPDDQERTHLAHVAASRTPTLTPVRVAGSHDALAIIDALLLAAPEAQPGLKKQWRQQVLEQEASLSTVLKSMLATTFGTHGVLLVLEGLEEAFEKPAADPTAPAKVAPTFRASLLAVLSAFARRPTRSRLLITSSRDFALIDSRDTDLAAGLARVSLAADPKV
jgi:hypothetical protein